VAVSANGGASFTGRRIVEKTKTYSDAPKLTVDSGGRVHLVWMEGDHVRYTYSADAAKTFAKSRQISNGRVGFPSLAVEGKAIHVTWELFHEHRYRPRGLGYAVSRDSGASFGAPAIVPGSVDRGGGWNGSFQGLLMRKLAVHRDGTVAIVNSSVKDGQHSRVWLIRATP
jgi:uncharacterized membrane protein